MSLLAAWDQSSSGCHSLRDGNDAVPDSQYRWSKFMPWNTPKIVEIALGAEINCYACAELNA
jgi:coenzyme PQQ precursor peptide PqqA